MRPFLGSSSGGGTWKGTFGASIENGLRWAVGALQGNYLESFSLTWVTSGENLKKKDVGEKKGRKEFGSRREF